MAARRVYLPGFVCLVVASLLSAHANAAISFIEASNAAGLPNNITPTYGLSVGDINGDGLPDVFVNNHALRNSIFRNSLVTPGVFQDVHRQVDAERFWETRDAPDKSIRAFRDTHGAAWMDYDNDGDQDLLITTGTCCDPDFFVNDAGLLYQRTTDLGLGNNSDRGGRSSVWYDSNGDGVLEMSFITAFTATWLEQAGGQFVEDSSANFNCSRNLYGVEVDFAGDPNLEMMCVAPGARFTRAVDVTRRPFRNVAWMLPDMVNVMDVVLGDFDGNLRTDMLLLTGALRPSELVSFSRPGQGKWGLEALIRSQQRGFSFRTTGTVEVSLNWNGTLKDFTNVNIGAGAVSPQNEMSFVLDPNDSSVVGTPPRTAGIPEVNISYDPGTGAWTFDVYPGSKFLDAYLTITSNAPLSNLTMRNFNNVYDGPHVPTLLSNTTQGVADATSGAGLTTPLRCPSGVAGDFDNDMDLDVFLVCTGGAQNLPNVLLENNGHGVFTMVPGAGGAAGITGMSVTERAGNGDSVVSLDYDRDGRLDVMVANGLNLYPQGRPGNPVGGPYELFRNQSWVRNWLQIDLVGTQSNRDAIGARVYVDAGGVRQFRQQDGGFHRWSQNHKRLHFGLKTNSRADITVRWPSGLEETFPNVASKRIYRITEGDGIQAVF
jgi:hypothetical protein